MLILLIVAVPALLVGEGWLAFQYARRSGVPALKRALLAIVPFLAALCWLAWRMPPGERWALPRTLPFYLVLHLALCLLAALPRYWRVLLPVLSAANVAVAVGFAASYLGAAAHELQGFPFFYLLLLWQLQYLFLPFSLLAVVVYLLHRRGSGKR